MDDLIDLLGAAVRLRGSEDDTQLWFVVVDERIPEVEQLHACGLVDRQWSRVHHDNLWRLSDEGVECLCALVAWRASMN